LSTATESFTKVWSKGPRASNQKLLVNQLLAGEPRGVYQLTSSQDEHNKCPLSQNSVSVALISHGIYDLKVCKLVEESRGKHQNI
jgi:hypothetical protein